MNNQRVIMITNFLLIASGYQWHCFNRKTKSYQLSIFAIVNCVCLLLLYTISFNQHFENSGLLQLLTDLSPFLRRLVRIQLLVGLKVVLLVIYEVKKVTAAARALACQLTYDVTSQKFARNEAISYVILFMPLSILGLLVLYIAYQMEFKLPPLDHIFIGMALFLPQFILAGALRLFSVGMWLLQQNFQELSQAIEQGLIPSQSESTNVIIVPLQPLLVKWKLHLADIAATQRTLSKALHIQLSLLFLLNCNCLLATSYSFFYFENIWHVLFSTRGKRVFYAASVGIYLLICCDYICIGLVQHYFDRKFSKLWSTLSASLKDYSSWTKNMRRSLKDIRNILSNNFQFGQLHVANFRFLQLQLSIVLAIAIFIVHSYLNEQITLLTSRLDDNEGDKN